MTIQECLRELYEEEMQRVFETSGNWLLNCPRKGLEAEWDKHQQRAEILHGLVEGLDRQN